MGLIWEWGSLTSVISGAPSSSLAESGTSAFPGLGALAGTPPTVGLGHAYVPSTREDYDNAKELWKGDWAKYRTAHPNDQDCSISESDNWKGAQQCSQSWECRGARLCERGGWCSGYDGCEGTPLPDQAPGLLPDC